MTEKVFLEALQAAYERAGTQQRLADQIGISQSTIAGYFSGRYSIGNMTVTTLIRLFPDMKIDFFGGGEADPIETQIMSIVRGLTIEEKALCLKILAANFPEKIVKEMKI